MTLRTSRILSLTAAFAVAAATFALAKDTKTHGKGCCKNEKAIYKAGTVVELSGEVVKVIEAKCEQADQVGIHVMLKTDKETIVVDLGPAWFINNQEEKLEKKDQIVVKGARTVHEGEPTIIARTIRKGDAVLTLRDEDGFPVWRGWRAKPAS
jgi:hypothetical protein